MGNICYRKVSSDRGRNSGYHSFGTAISMGIFHLHPTDHRPLIPASAPANGPRLRLSRNDHHSHRSRQLLGTLWHQQGKRSIPQASAQQGKQRQPHHNHFFDQTFSFVRRSPWATRGWTFQESHLSKRWLFFADDQVFWDCSQDWGCETLMTCSKAQLPKSIYDRVHLLGVFSLPRLEREALDRYFTEN